MLSLIEDEPELWERFRDGLVDARHVATSPLLRHWQRARALGVPSEGVSRPDGVDQDELFERRGREELLLWAADAALRDLRGELSRRGVMAVLADRDGIVLHAVGAGRGLSLAARARLIEGACWSEGARGTNAIGTALYDERMVHVRGRAHFERQNHALFCLAAPVQDAHGRVIAALDFSGHVQDDDRELLRLLRSAVHQLERRLHAAQTRQPPSARHATVKPSADEAAPHPAFAELWSSDLAVRELLRRASRFARSELPLLVHGETGSGKELLARALHQASHRAGAPFVALNCAALSPSLGAAELFGHGPHAFTGAARGGQAGTLEAAHGGTLFLDEIAELHTEAQAALLRVLEDGTFFRVGEQRPRKVELRLLCATHKDLHTEVERGVFRADLYFRLAAAQLTLPALRARSDRFALAERLLAPLAADAGRRPPRLGASARAHLQRHDWPGNVRELKNALLHALVLAGDAPELLAEHFPAARPLHLPTAPPSAPQLGGGPIAAAPASSRRALLQHAARDALSAHGGNVSRAAQQLGVARSTLYRMLRTRD